MQGRARQKLIKDQTCSMLLLASAQLLQLLSAFYLTLTKGANCLAKEEGSLILSCCRWIAQARAKGQEAKGEEEEVMLKVGATVGVQPSADFHSCFHLSANAEREKRVRPAPQHCHPTKTSCRFFLVLIYWSSFRQRPKHPGWREFHDSEDRRLRSPSASGSPRALFSKTQALDLKSRMKAQKPRMKP